MRGRGRRTASKRAARGERGTGEINEWYDGGDGVSDKIERTYEGIPVGVK